MSTDKKLLASEIRSALRPLPPSLTGASAGSDLYEAYLLTLIIRAARQEKAKISYGTVSGNPARQFVFRTSPGNLYSTAQNYTHVIIQFDGKPDLEAHVGVYVTGRSQVPHECDVVVLDRDDAENCRRSNSHPRRSSVVFSVEAKFYSDTLPLPLGRGFIGLARDMVFYRTCFVATTSSATVTRLLTNHRAQWFHNVNARSQESADLVAYFAGEFRRYKAR